MNTNVINFKKKKISINLQLNIKKGKKMKIKVLTLLLVFLFLGGFIRVAKAELVVNIAYVDAQRIFNEYNKTKDFQTMWDSQKEEASEQIEAKKKEIEKLREELKSQELLLTEEAKKKREEEIAAKANELNNFINTVSQQINEKNEEYSKEILKDIKLKVKEIAEREGYRFVFYKDALIYVTPEPQFDLTEKVISELNQDYKAKK